MLARKIHFRSIALLLLACSISLCTFAQTRLGLHFTAEELVVWRERAQKGPYKATGDVSVNSPGDWTRILINANAYISSNTSTNYISDRWNGGYQGSGYVPNGFTTNITDCEPKGKFDKMMNAAFVYLITKDTRYSSRVKEEILNYYLKHPLMDFSNQKRWGLGGNSFNDINPGFFTAAGLTKLLYAYDYVKDTFTESEKALVDAWFYKVGNFFRLVVDEKIAPLYSDRANSILKDPSLRTANTDGHKTHDNGYVIPNISHWYNNRRGDMVRLYAMTGIYLNDATMKTSAKLFFKEWLKYGIFPDGTMNEYYRGSVSLPEQGYQYSMITVSQMVEIADAFARTGDKELYTYTTSDGIAATKGGNKTLLLVMQNASKYIDKSFNRYFPGKAGQANYRLDGISPLENKHYTFDTWFAQANTFYKDSNFTSIYLRKKQGTPAYPAKSTNIGFYQPWSGSFGTFPGKLFMFGQMEGKVNPYPGSTSIVPSTPPAAPTEGQSMVSFTLMNADTEQPIKTLVDGESLNLSSLPTRNLNIRANTNPVIVGSVVFALSGSQSKNLTETSAPYALFGDASGNYNAWIPAIGSYTLVATPYTAAGGTGSKGTALTVNFTVSNGTTTSCSATGTILREYWGNSTGNSVTAIPLNAKPTATSQLSSFEAPSNAGDNYGQRVRGYICAPSSGNYIFYIAGDDSSELYLSTDDNPSNRKKIAYSNTWTGARQWTRYGSQKSAVVYLSAGEKYYIEALQKESAGGDNLAVGWTLPNTSNINVIAGSYLSPFVISSTARMASSEENIEGVSASTVFPNPFKDILSVQTIYTGELQISLIDALGRVCYQITQMKETPQLDVDLSQANLKDGIYFMKLQGKNIPAEVIRIIKQ